MAFGTIVDSAVGNASSTTDMTLTLTGATAGNLLIFCHFTGATDSLAPAGFSEAGAVADGSNLDELAIYYKIAEGGETSITAKSGVTDDEHMGYLCEVEGPFRPEPLDGTASNGATSESSTSSGTTGTTAQASEFAIAALSARSLTSYSAWTNSFTERADQQSTVAKTLGVATKLLTATGTVETTANHGTATSMGLMATFMEELTTQEGYRFRNDDGSETTATWKAAQDTATSVAASTNFRLRVLLDRNE